MQKKDIKGLLKIYHFDFFSLSLQGRFYQCRKEGGSVIHNFHKQCQVFRDNKYYCPHCGEESSQYEVTLTLNEPRMPSSLKEKEKSQPEPPVPPP